MSYLLAFGHYLRHKSSPTPTSKPEPAAPPPPSKKPPASSNAATPPKTSPSPTSASPPPTPASQTPASPPQDIGLILFSSGSAERAFPGPASVLAAKLGLTATPAIDIPIASAGSLIAIAFAADLAPRYGNVLVVASEIMSRRISDADPDTAILFGDGAGACIVSPDKGFLRIADTALFTDGNYADALQLQHGGAIQMKGLDVIIQASRKIPRAIEDLLTKNNLKPSDVGVYPHASGQHESHPQSRHRSPGPRRPLLPQHRPLRQHLLCLSPHRRLRVARRKPTPPTTPIVLATFGAGFNWGAILALPA